MSTISQAKRSLTARLEARTCDVFVQYRIFLDHVVYQPPRVGVYYQDFPLLAWLDCGSVEVSRGY